MFLLPIRPVPGPTRTRFHGPAEQDGSEKGQQGREDHGRRTHGDPQPTNPLLGPALANRIPPVDEFNRTLTDFPGTHSARHRLERGNILHVTDLVVNPSIRTKVREESAIPLPARTTVNTPEDEARPDKRHQALDTKKPKQEADLVGKVIEHRSSVLT